MFYPIAIEAGDHEHAYGVIVPDLPGCFSAADTLDEAIKNAKEAITGHIELCVELGHEIPAVSTIEALATNPDYQGYIWALVDVDVIRLLGGSEKINVTLPRSLIDRIDRCVASHPEYKSRSGFLAQIALERITAPINRPQK
ncbi:MULTISPECIES: type II toxin-antitoxin system HicB family antitoxin [Pantoea]|nr:MULTISPECIES: type II toxin-antitoxin system HicB family antitoxin [Pantoea]MBA5703608.1 type II toxin-antitoxin system HicB family antitoxin [Pantoea agglomerans]MBB1229704.1 type II toxin-antitoxin system HicB family antitoxin [Pantoea pleuroti]MBD8144927.1 type II toxin-antitoxin system HicB family antitoxin [Pantoea agglomerans]MBD8181173.1 type II toxin-antitoxin system HicB family antitoxin [Pantoea agglomerans]MBD8222629.1 type II toxin-antitoxin system HicB family antitoxin [Pantoea